jgi:transposase
MRKFAANYQHQAFELACEGRNYDQISKALGISASTAGRAVKLAIAEYLALPKGDPDRTRAEKFVSKPKTLVQTIRHQAKLREATPHNTPRRAKCLTKPPSKPTPPRSAP